MWERFSTSGLAGSYVDELLDAGIAAHMEFKPRRARDPFPFLVSLADEGAGQGSLALLRRSVVSASAV